MNNNRDKIRLKEFGEHFRLIRKSKNLSQDALALEADIEKSQISRIERGVINPTVTTLLILAEAMEIPVSTFFKYHSIKGKSK